MRTYNLGQTAMVPFNLVRDVLSLDEGGPEEDEGIGRARNVRRILALVLGVCAGRAHGRRTRWRHDEHRRRWGWPTGHGNDLLVIEIWIRFCSERETHARVRVVNQRGHVIWTPAGGTRGQRSRVSRMRTEDLPSISSRGMNSRSDMARGTSNFSNARWGAGRKKRGVRPCQRLFVL